MRNELGAYVLELKKRQVKVTLKWVSAIGHLSREEQVDQALYRQVGAALLSQALVFMWDFNHPYICWRKNTARHKQSRRFLECINDNFVLQVIEEPTKRDALLDLMLTNKEMIIGDVKIKGSFACSDHEMVEFRILRAG